MTIQEIQISLNKGSIIKRETWEGNKCLFFTKPTVITMQTAAEGSLLKKALLAGGREKFDPSFIEAHYDLLDGKTIIINYKFTEEELNADNWLICQA